MHWDARTQFLLECEAARQIEEMVAELHAARFELDAPARQDDDAVMYFLCN